MFVVLFVDCVSVYVSTVVLLTPHSLFYFILSLQNDNIDLIVNILQIVHLFPLFIVLVNGDHSCCCCWFLFVVISQHYRRLCLVSCL